MSDKIFVLQAKIIKALTHPLRLEIVHLLRHNILTVSQIIQMSGLSQSLISQHLKVLKVAQIVSSKREGKEIYYAISDQRILVACDSIHSLVSGEPLPITSEPNVVDPVCGMDLTPKTASFTTAYNGVRHYFCAKGCLNKFNINPGHYVR
ncbi:MAG: metalloregulator ArsR/SmtB family transcription factor [bacterium]